MTKIRFASVIRGSTTSVVDWQKAMAVGKDDLPELTPQQRAFSKRFGISEEEYARSVLAGRYGEERTKERTAALGNTIQQILDKRVPGARLERITAELIDGRWRLEFETKDQRRVVAFIPRALGDDVIDSGAPEVVRDLGTRILAALTAEHLPVAGE